jgi:hypothetical protein
MRRAVVVVAVVAACAVMTGTAGAVSRKDAAGATNAFRAQLQLLVDGKADVAYDQLHPAQQAVISREAYVGCAAKAQPLLAALISQMRITHIASALVTIPGTVVRARGLAISVKFRKVLGTFYEFKIRGQWRYVAAGVKQYVASRGKDC